MFSRVAFMILVSNVDDHLRNHGFLYAGSGRWELSPVFDVNPAPERLQMLKTPIVQEDEPDASIDLLMDHAFYFGLEADDAAALVASMAATIAGSWKRLAAEVGMTPAERKQYQPALEQTDMKISSVIHQP